MADNIHPRIVIAEDDEAILDLIRTRLEIAGYQTFYARDGFRAVETIIATRPAGVVLDLNMPGLDGFGVLSALKRDVRTSRIPVLILSARNVADDVAKGLKLGAKDYLTKPFDDRVLVARVARLVRKGPNAPIAAKPPVQDAFLI